MKPISPTLQTTYANLLQAHLSRPVMEFEGAPFTRKLGSKSYWYANHRMAPGAPLKQRYIGPDTDDMRARIEAMQLQRQSNADFRAYASSLVALLRAGGITGPDRKTGPMLRMLANSGVFRLGGVLVGTHAYRHYDLTLGVRLSDNAAWITQTEDIDIASFPVALEDSADPDLAAQLIKLGYVTRPTLNRKPSTTWTLPDASYAIDFLTPSFREEEGPVEIPALNIWAQSLHFLNFLLTDPVDAVTPYMEGLLIKIPRPERYAVHKLIVSQRRKGPRAKAQKDIEQARTLIWALNEDRPYEIHHSIAEADAKGPKWREALDRALDIRFQATKLEHSFDRDVVMLEGLALNQVVRFAISAEALDDHFGATGSAPEQRIDAVRKNRARIEEMIKRKFRAEPAPDIIVTTADAGRFLQS